MWFERLIYKTDNFNTNKFNWSVLSLTQMQQFLVTLNVSITTIEISKLLHHYRIVMYILN